MTSSTSPSITPRMISDYCRKRVAIVLSPSETEAMRQYLIKLLELGISPPRLIGHDIWVDVSLETGITIIHLKAAHHQLAPIFDAVTRSISRHGARANRGKGKPAIGDAALCSENATSKPETRTSLWKRENKPARIVRIYRETPAEEGPKPLWTEWNDPETFAQALQLHIDRHGETPTRLYRSVVCEGHTIDLRGFIRWCTGGRVPRSIQSLNILSKIERRYRLPVGYFKAKIPHQARAARGHIIGDISPAERRRLAWHLPDDFNLRSTEEQEEILCWVKKVIISGSTEYRIYQATAMRTRYSVRFRTFQRGRRRSMRDRARDDAEIELDTELQSSVVDAPAILEEEMRDLLRFKTSTLTAFGFQRNGVWNEETASQKIEHLGLLFGALTASPQSAVRGFGADLDSLCFAMLVFPSVWDWYLQWREHRRGFYTKWEVDMLSIVLAMVREGTGWLRQNPSLASRLKPIPALISENDITAARTNWNGTCDAMHCSSSDNLRLIRHFEKGGSGSSGVRV